MTSATSLFDHPTIKHKLVGLMTWQELEQLALMVSVIPKSVQNST